MLTPEYLAGIPYQVEQLTLDLEEAILSDICRRVAKVGYITDTAEYQILRLKEFGAANEFIEKAIADYAGLSETAVRGMFFDAAQTSTEFYKDIYLKSGTPFVPLAENAYYQQLIAAGIKQTQQELVNFTQSMGFAVAENGERVFLPIAKTYQKILDTAQMQVMSGVFDYNTAIRTAVSKLTENGLQFIDYETGRRNRCDVAARRAVLTGISQMSGKISEQVMSDLDTDIVEVTAHAGARPDHAAWQGKWYSLSGASEKYPSLVEKTKYGEGAGLKGWNCRHDFYAVIPGISVPAYTQDELDNIDPPPIEYNGKKYDYYQCTQKQRQMETAMRKTKRDIIGADSSGDEDKLAEKAILLRRQKEEYEKFSKEAKLLTQYERTQEVGYNRSISAKASAAARKGSTSKNSGGIIKESQPSEVRKLLQKSGIEYRDVQKLSKQLDTQEIIQRLGGGDETEGSCSSLAFAYIGNKNGLDVLDFRNGKSREFFSEWQNIVSIAKLDGVNSQIVSVSNEIKGTINMLKTIEWDKEYYLAVGEHAAIVRATKQSGHEYLELQSAISNGFKPLTSDALRRRFGATKSRTSLGRKYNTTVALIDCDSFKGNDEFRKILGYMNTSADNQIKGVGGYVK